MFQSLVVYTILGVILLLLGHISSLRELYFKSNNLRMPFFVWDVNFALFTFSFFSAVRWNVGVDYLAYLKNYLKIQDGHSAILEKEIGFEYLTRFIAGTGLHFSIYFGILAFLQIFFVYYSFRNERYLYPFLGIVIVFGPEYLNWMNGIRQELAATIFVFSIQFIRDRRFLKYLSLILLSSLIHNSAIFLILFYFIPNKEYFKSRFLAFILVILSLIIGSKPFFIFSIIPILNSNGLLLQSLEFASSVQRDMDFGPRRLIIFLLNCFIIWYYPLLKRYFSQTNFISFFNLSFLGFLYFNIFANTGHIFLRPVSYFSIFLVFTTSYLLVYLKNLGGVSLKFVSIFFLGLLYLFFSIVADSSKGIHDSTNYKFFWDHTN